MTMQWSKLKIATAAAVLIALLGGGVGMFWSASTAAEPDKPFKAVPLDAPQVKSDRTKVVQGNSQFAFDLYGQLRRQDGNLFVSPYSVSTALAMTAAGARGDTLQQMEKVLHFPVDQERLHPAVGALVQDTRNGKGYQLSTANALWCQINYNLLDNFLSTNETYYRARPTGLDFKTKTEEARQTINGWVEKQTQDKIKELLKPGILDAETKLVLTNAIYFKGDWDVQFDKKYTKDAPFLGTAGKVSVPLMTRTASFKYLDAGSFQAVELPYVNKELAMVVFLPKQVDGLAELEKSLTADKLAEWTGKMAETDVTVSLPRFKLTLDYELNAPLENLGMSDAFSARQANFAGIIGKKELYISKVVHKAFVDVTEEGTEAAAATAVIIKPTGLPRKPIVFRADHPFFFVIRDNRTGSLLFMGRLVDPK